MWAPCGYYALIYPNIFYGNVVWANAYQSHLKKIYKLQKKLVRIITFKVYNHSSKPLFDNLKILNVYQVNYYSIAILMEKSFSNNQLPISLKDIFRTNEGSSQPQHSIKQKITQALC